ncbi:MAG TPA: phosphotransferase [Streptosporangiaceae bacterium]|nr:phosphotransferase [Streptosporangiaceae bacterium]
MSTRRFAAPEQLAEVARSAFGSGRRLVSVTRLPDGSKKGVYRLAFADGWSAIAYVWNAAENYWPAPPQGPGPDRADPFAEASGVDLFEASSDYLSAAGVRTPRAYLLDRSGSSYPADLALVEDVRGGTLEAMLRRDPQAAERVLVRLGEYLDVMRQHRGPRPGKLALIGGEAHDGIPDRPCEQFVLDRALGDLAEAASRVDRVAACRDQLDDVVRGLAAAVRPRAELGLIHGELGPDHVLVANDGQPVLIDVEGAMFFDVEWEHVFLRLRFGEHYRWLATEGLDQQRLRFYALAMHLSLVAGPLRLLDGDFPDRAVMLEIAEYNLERALTFLAAGESG